MELFIPSALILLLAAAVIFFVLPRFGAPVLALISLGLLIYGVREHMNAFGTEYRFSTWQLSLIGYAPYVMVGGLLLVIAFYLLSMSPWGKTGTTAPEMPTIAEMPSANTATNTVTAGVNNALKGASGIFGTAAAAVGLNNAAKTGNNKGAVNEAAKKANEAATGIANTMKNALGAITGNNKSNNKGNNNNNNTNNNAAKSRIPGLNFPLSQV